MTTPVTDHPFLTFDMIPLGVDLVAEVRALDEAGVEVPWAWCLSRDPIDVHDQEQGFLTFGVNNGVGPLQWTTGGSTQVPVGGSNPEWLGYFLAGSHETNIPPFAEVPVETVYAVVAEFLRTGGRPTCVQWTGAASLLSLFE